MVRKYEKNIKYTESILFTLNRNNNSTYSTYMYIYIFFVFKTKLFFNLMIFRC